MATGRYNIAVGFLMMAAFMLLGFGLIYMHDLASGRAEWIAQYGSGDHFEVRLAHVHGTLFALMNVAIGFVLSRAEGHQGRRRALAALGITGMLMPIGIASEVALGLPPVLVIVGAVAMTIATGWAGVIALRDWQA
jgi:hypothetical protein